MPFELDFHAVGSAGGGQAGAGQAGASGEEADGVSWEAPMREPGGAWERGAGQPRGALEQGLHLGRPLPSPTVQGGARVGVPEEACVSCSRKAV